MALPKNKQQREHDKFDINKDGEVIVRTDSSGSNSNIDLVEILELQNKKIDKLIDIIAQQQETMGQKGILRDGHGNGHKAKITSRGQLVTAPLEFSIMHSIVLTSVDTPTLLVAPEIGKQFVVTDLILYADKSVGTNDASVVLYEADDPTDAIGAGDPSLSLEIVKKTTVPLTGLNFIINEGKWIVATTNDNNIYINIAGYYVATGE